MFLSKTVQKLNTIRQRSELEQTQLLTMLAMTVQNPHLAGYLLTGNRSNVFCVEGSTAWLYDFPLFFSPLYEAAKCFDRTPVYHQDMVLYIDPRTRHFFNYATALSYDNSQQNVIALDSDCDGLYILTPKPVIRATLMLIDPTQDQFALNQNIFTGQEAGSFSNAELTNSLIHETF